MEVPELKVTIKNNAVLQIEHEGRLVGSLSLPLLNKLHKTVMDLANTEDLKVIGKDETRKITRDQVVAYAEKYLHFVNQMTGRRPQYVLTPEGKYYTHFVKATELSQRFNFAPEEIFELLTTFYTQMNRESPGATLPYPNQLHGEKAESFLLQAHAKSDMATMPAHVRAQRLANKRRNMALDQDDDYQRIRRSLSLNKFTEFDLEYLKAKQVQKLGKVQDWVEKYQKQLNERLAGVDGTT